MTQVLVVDDEISIREMLIEFLEDHGLSAEGAADGREAVTLAQVLKPRVILLDIAMPGMNGIETLQELRRQAPGSAVIMISGHADLNTALQALDLGAYDFIQKPLDFDYLERTLITKIATLDPAGPHEAPKEHRDDATRLRGRRSR
jgi:two-component system nitrogen regulation response regulator NtrX